MLRQNTRVQIQQCEGGLIELRYFETQSTNCYLGWKLAAAEAKDLARWWTSQGKQAHLRDLPIRRLRAGCILVSMVTLGTVEVHGVNKHGRAKLKGHSLPREVVECLAEQRIGVQPSKTTRSPKVAEAC